jgi:hypothetical protein
VNTVLDENSGCLVVGRGLRLNSRDGSTRRAMLTKCGYGVFGTSGVIVDGRVKSVGKIPEKAEISTWFEKRFHAERNDESISRKQRILCPERRMDEELMNWVYHKCLPSNREQGIYRNECLNGTHRRHEKHI